MIEVRTERDDTTKRNMVVEFVVLMKYQVMSTKNRPDVYQFSKVPKDFPVACHDYCVENGKLRKVVFNK